eukprot:COSAG01_NODE_15656_length_1314_cov_1.713580_2_plen_106_part_01
MNAEGIPVLVRGEGGWLREAQSGKPHYAGGGSSGWGDCANSPRFTFDFHAAAWAVASYVTTPSWFTRYAYGYTDSAFAWDSRFNDVIDSMTVLGKPLGTLRVLGGY